MSTFKVCNSPADSSFCKGALANEYSIIVSMNPIAFAARLPSGPGILFWSVAQIEASRKTKRNSSWIRTISNLLHIDVYEIQEVR